MTRKKAPSDRAKGACARRADDAPAHRAAICDITEPKQTEDALLQSRALLRSITEGTSDAIYVKDAQGRYLMLNSAASRFVGKPAEEILGNDDTALFPPDEARQIMEGDRRVMASGGPQTYEEFVTASGVARTFLSTKGPVRDARGKVIGLFAIARDITECKRAEDALRESEQQFRGLNALQEALLPSNRVERKLGFITEEVVRSVGADFARVWMIRPGDRCDTGCIHAMVTEGPHTCRSRDRCLHLLASSGRYTHTDGRDHSRVPFGSYKIGRIASGEEAKFLTNEVTSDPRVHNHTWAKELGLVSFAGYRLSDAAGTPLGVLGLFSKQSISPLEDSLLQGIAQIASHVLNSARAEEAVRESEARYRTLFDSGNDAIFLMKEGRFVDCNVRTLEIFGCDREQILNHSPAYFSPETQRDGSLSAASAQDRMQAALAGEPQSFVWLHCRQDRSLFDAEVSLKRIELSGEAFLQAIVRDITAHRQADELRTAIYQISEATQATGSLDELFRSIHAIIGRLMDARNFYITLYDPLTNMLSFRYFVDEVEQPPAPYPLDHGMTAYVLRHGQPELVSSERFSELRAAGKVDLVGSPSVDWLGVPLRVRDSVIGALVVQSYHEDVRYSEADKEMLSYVSTQVAQAIERKRADEALRESEERYRQLVELSPDAIAVHCDGELVLVNSAALRLLGADDPAKLLGRPVLEFVHPDARSIVVERIGKMLKEGASVPLIAERFLRLDGSAIDVEVAAGPFMFQGRPAIQVAFRDVTERKRAEEALEQSRAQLLHAQKMEAVGRLAGGVAHDFNNVLQSMLSHVQLLRASDPNPRRVALLGAELERQIKRASALTRQLLVFSRQESARPEHLDLNEVIEQASGMLRPLVRENIAFLLQLAEESLMLKADRGQLDQVLMNLVVNASDAIPAGGTITLRTGREGENVWLEVEDTGHGIPAEVLPRIFEPFFTTKAVGQGTGLGLSVVHGIVTAWGGRVDVRSAVGTGTTMRLLFPSEAPGAAPLPPPVDLLGDVPPGEGERVLLVEDEQSVREALAEMLTMLGYQVTAAASAEEAGRLPVEPAYDLLLTDFMLPGAHGGELAKDLLDRWPALAVIVMSGYTDDEAIRRGVREGEVRFLQKPFDMSAVAREIRAALSHPN